MHPCDKAHKYRCLFEYEYADNTLVEGYVVEGDVRFDLSNGSRVQMSIPFGYFAFLCFRICVHNNPSVCVVKDNVHICRHYDANWEIVSTVIQNAEFQPF